MTFDEFKSYCRVPAEVEKYRKSFGVYQDYSGAFATESVGFHVSVTTSFENTLAESRVTEAEAEAIALYAVFKPMVVWAGSTRAMARLRDLGIRASLNPYFQDGAFMVILQVPATKLNT